MPKVISQVVVWLPERGSYVIHKEGNSGISPLPDKKSEWYAWLAARRSFAFQGKHGHLTLRKEKRARQEGYWYAYRCHNRRTIKRYAGRTHDLNLTRLEEIARDITEAFEQLQQDTEKASEEELTEPLLISKLCPPHMQRSLIVRERLLLQLDAALERRLTLLCAPAGAGKTTLVRQWIAVRGTDTSFPPPAWISLDAGDNDLQRFWRYVLTACRIWFPAAGQHTLHALLTAPHPAFHTAVFQPRPLKTALISFLNEIARQNCPGLLILDDYHLISDPGVHETLGFFLAHLPETVHIILITRHEPPLPLVRLRANGDLNEIRAADLRFSREETATFLKDLPLPPEVLEQLDSHLEGWAAGLRLLSLSLQHTMDPAQIECLLATFSGSHRPILDYFVGEVLHTQAEKVQEFLLRTSLLPRLSPSLCTAVTGYQESAALLESIERANLFLEALDGSGEWYRYHALFAEAMQHEARRRLDEEELHELFRAASRWFEQHDLFPEAIEAALTARDYERAAGLIERQANRQNFQEPQEHLTMHRWLEQLPEDLIHRHPALCFSYAATLVFSANNRQGHGQVLPARAEDLLRRAEEGWRASNDFAGLGKLFAFRTLLTFEQKKRAEAVVYARQALAYLPETEITWRSISLMTLGAEAILKGLLNEARYLYQQVHLLWQTTGNADAAIGTAAVLGMLCFAQGDLHQAASYYRQFADGAARSKDHPAAAIAPLGLALVHYEWNELEIVEQQIQTALEREERLTDTGPKEFLRVPLGLIQTALEQARGKIEPAIQRLRTLLPIARTLPDELRSYLYSEAFFWLVRLSLASGDDEAAQYWLNEFARQLEAPGTIPPERSDMPLLNAPTKPHTPTPKNDRIAPPADADMSPELLEQQALLAARVLLARNEVESALAVLTSLLPAAQAAGRGRNVLQIRLLMAQAYAARKAFAEARRLLLEALKQGYASGHRRIFLDEGDGLFMLLRDLLPHVRGRLLYDYVQTLLRAFAEAQSVRGVVVAPVITAPFEPLSIQEQRVLRLLAAGRSNGEIARELVVSVNTVRTHVQSIYRKLDVHNRNAAGEVARRSGLL